MNSKTARWVLILSSVASLMVALDALVVSTALGVIRTSLHASIDELEWTVNAYGLSFAVLLVPAAALGDRLGRRRLFAAGLGLFVLGSIACALSPNAGLLIASRAVQGSAAALVAPLSLALVSTAFPPERRGWAMGVYGGITGIAVLGGPVIGGAVTQGLAWQWVFWINVPIALIAIPLVFRRLAEATGPGGAVDLLGLALVSVAALGLVWGLVRGNTAGWRSAETVGALAAGAVAACCFAWWQRRAPAPMLPPRLYRSRAFSAGNATIFLLNGSLGVGVFLMPQLQQVVLGQHPLSAGLRLLPWGIAPFLLAPRAGALADRLGARWLAVTGLILQTAGMSWIAAISTPTVSYLALVAPMTLVGVGFAGAIPAVTRAATSGTPMADIGKASGAYSTMRQLGGAFGIAAGGAAFAAAGGYLPKEAFSDGFTAAIAVAAALALAGVATALALPGRARHPAPSAPSAPSLPSAAPAPSTPGQGRRRESGVASVTGGCHGSETVERP